MRRVGLDELMGGEVLAKHIVTDSGFELMTPGTVLKKDYISRLKELDYQYVYIRDNNSEKLEQEIDLLSKDVNEKSMIIVKEVLSKRVLKNGRDIAKLCKVAEMIMEDVLSNESILNELINIRRTSPSLYTHSINVCTLSTIIGLKNNFTKDRIADMARGSIIHDIGLKYITVDYENVNVSDLNSEEQSIFKKHAILGFEAVKDIEWLPKVSKDIILLHHETKDRNGYPHKIGYEDILEEVKIVSICDAFDSLITGIGHIQVKIHEAIEYLNAYSDKKYEEKYVEQLVHTVALYPIGTKVKTNVGEQGIVIKQNKKYPNRPILSIIIDKKGIKLREPIEKDLLKDLTTFIEDTVE